MALLFCDSFDHYATADITTKWASTVTGGAAGNATINAVGRNSTSAARIAYSGGGNANGPNIASRTLPVSGATVIMGAAVSVSTLLAAARNGIFVVYDGTTAQLAVKVNSDGTLSVLRGDTATGTVLGTTSSGISTGSFFYIEFKALIDPTVGTYEIKINGTSALSGSGANTRNSSASQWTRVGLGKEGGNTPGASANIDIDDFYVCDGSGANNNTYLGDVRVKAQLPSTGNGTNADFTCSTGTDHGALVDETTPNTSDYNSSSTVNHRDTYNFATLGLSGTVKAVQTSLYTAKSDAGTRTVAPVHRISGANYDGTTVSLGTSFTYQLQVYETSPATAAAWTTTEINAAETGIKLVS